MDYIYRYDMCAIVVAVSILVSLIRNKTIPTRTVKTFEIWFISIILSSAFDSISILFLMYPSMAPLWLNYLVNIGYHVCFIFIPQVFYYSIYFATEDNKIPARPLRLLFGIPYFIILGLLILTPFTGTIFYFDDNMVYHRGKLFFINYVVAGFYLLACVYRSIKYRRHFSAFQFFSVWFYMGFSIITLVIQIYFPQIMMMNFSIAVSAMVGYLSLENPSDYIDKEMPMYNRNGFVEYMNNYLYKRKDVNILGIQIVGFKAMENAIGNKNKLALLNQLGSDMLKVSPMNRNFRISQSRFAILLDDNPEKQQKQIKDIINYSLQAFQFGDVKLLISINAVLIKCPEDASTVEDIVELMEHSFTKTVTFTDNQVPRADRNVLLKRYAEQKMVEKIKTALNRGDFYVYYQPSFNPKSGKYACAEALIRVKTNSDTIVHPEDFIPVNEKSGMILKIVEFILESVCRFIVDTKPYEHGIEFIVINLPVLICMQADLSEKVISIFNKYKIDPKYIRLEVSESSTSLAKDILLSNMIKMNNYGIKFSLDGFGTGISNIANIVKFPIDAIKIDKSMISSAVKEEKALIILKENISMIKDMGLYVIAECVEDEKEIELLKSLDIDFLQGYNYPLPLTTNDFSKLISTL